MTNTPNPSNRRRRRIIVAFVLVLVALGSWWYWPRGDARFVGKWVVVNHRSQRTGAEVTFSANGFGSMAFPAGDRVRFRWEALRGGIIMARGLSSGSRSWLRRLVELHSKLSGDQWLVGSKQLNLKPATEHDIRIADPGLLVKLGASRLVRHPE